MNLHKAPAVFRPEIEGLRAIAALLVAVFHIWLGRVSGGVDVFFVVSSFLITTGLLGHIDRWQRVDFALFWGRLIKRLVPVAYIVLCAVVVVGIVMMPVLVLHGLMGVFMLMAFLQVHPEANAHQAAGKHEPHR